MRIRTLILALVLGLSALLVTSVAAQERYFFSELPEFEVNGKVPEKGFVFNSEGYMMVFLNQTSSIVESQEFRLRNAGILSFEAASFDMLSGERISAMNSRSIASEQNPDLIDQLVQSDIPPSSWVGIKLINNDYVNETWSGATLLGTCGFVELQNVTSFLKYRANQEHAEEESQIVSVLPGDIQVCGKTADGLVRVRAKTADGWLFGWVESQYVTDEQMILDMLPIIP